MKGIKAWWIVPVVVAVAALVIVFAQGQKQSPLAGSWTVSEVLCDGCQGPVLQEKGKRLTFGINTIVNPLSGNCDAKPGYQLLSPIPGRQLLAKQPKGLPAAAARRIGAASTVIHGFVTCNGINYAQVAVLPDKAALLFGEGNVVFLLTRLP